MDTTTATVSPPPITIPEVYIAANLAEARRNLDAARSLLLERPAITMPADHLATVIQAAGNAAEHLYDVEQVDDHVEAVREALAAAEAIMVVVRELRTQQPGIVFPRERMARQLLTVDRTLGALQRTYPLH